MKEDENAAANADAKEEEEELLWDDLEQRMEAASYDMERRVEAALEASKIAKSGIKEAVKEDRAKAAACKSATKAANSVSSDENSSTATSDSTTAPAFARDPTSIISVVGVARKSGYKLLIIMLKVFDSRIRYIVVSTKWQARAEAVRVERKRQVDNNQRVAEEKLARVEAEKKISKMKTEKQAAAMELAF